MIRSMLAVLATGIAGQVAAADLHIDVEVPRINVAEYHKPYIAIWIARQDQTVAADLGVWYQLDDGPEGEGTTWLKDLRQWWRRSGRNLDLPVDGVTGATRGPGRHELRFPVDAPPLAQLENGDYLLIVEAVREVGGREMLKIPFRWGDEAFSAQAAGEHELGNVLVKITPH